MKAVVLTLALGAFALSATATDFSQKTSFESVEDFKAKAKAFEPATSSSDLSALFVVQERGMTEDGKVGKKVSAKSIELCETLWASDSAAVIFARGLPPTENTYSVAAVLFVIKRTGDSWRISEARKFTAFGKDSQILAQQTASTSSGPNFVASGEAFPVITITELRGGRGYSYEVSGTYTFKGEKLERLDLE